MPLSQRTRVSIVGMFLALPCAAATAPKQVVVKPFDISVASLPTDYRGNDFMAVFNKVRVARRGEFETKDQYRQRLAALVGYFAFRVAPELRYNPDRQAFRISVYPKRVYTGFLVRGNIVDVNPDAQGLDDADAIVVSKRSVRAGKYVGVNAFGIKVQVERFLDTELAIASKFEVRYDPDQQAFTSGELGFPDLLLEMPPERAASVKASLRFLLVCRLAPLGDSGLAMASTEHIEPGIDHPVDITTKHFYVVADLMALWAFDDRTGEVLKKFKLVGGVENHE